MVVGTSVFSQSQAHFAYQLFWQGCAHGLRLEMSIMCMKNMLHLTPNLLRAIQKQIGGFTIYFKKIHLFETLFWVGERAIGMI